MDTQFRQVDRWSRRTGGWKRVGGRLGWRTSVIQLHDGLLYLHFARLLQHLVFLIEFQGRPGVLDRIMLIGLDNLAYKSDRHTWVFLLPQGCSHFVWDSPFISAWCWWGAGWLNTRRRLQVLCLLPIATQADIPFSFHRMWLDRTALSA